VKKTTGSYPRLAVDAKGGSAVGQAGGVLLTSAIRAAGLDAGLSAALAPWRPVGARRLDDDLSGSAPRGGRGALARDFHAVPLRQGSCGVSRRSMTPRHPARQARPSVSRCSRRTCPWPR